MEAVFFECLSIEHLGAARPRHYRPSRIMFKQHGAYSSEHLELLTVSELVDKSGHTGLKLSPSSVYSYIWNLERRVGCLVDERKCGSFFCEPRVTAVLGFACFFESKFQRENYIYQVISRSCSLKNKYSTYTE